MGKDGKADFIISKTTLTNNKIFATRDLSYFQTMNRLSDFLIIVSNQLTSYLFRESFWKKNYNLLLWLLYFLQLRKSGSIWATIWFWVCFGEVLLSNPSKKDKFEIYHRRFLRVSSCLLHLSSIAKHLTDSENTLS